ncbi:MAG: glycosyltransferase [Segetibacter sp.]|nr:glycosyltransferase [Segetibacter sp.]
MTNSKSILLISSEFPPNVGGIGNHAYNLAKALSNEGYAVTAMADSIDVNEAEQRAFKQEQSFTIDFINRKKFVLQTYVERVIKGIRLSEKASIIICSGKFPLWLAIVLRLFNANKKIVAVVHGSELDIKSSLPRKLTFYALTKFNAIISVSNYTQRHLPQLPTSIKQFVIHNGINLQEFVAQPNELLKGEPALITVGSVTPRKGQENVINALPAIKETFPLVKYHVVGKPVIKERLVERSQELQLNGTVTFYGAVDRQELLNKLSSAKVKLMLSNHTADGDFEGFGIAVLEANAFGVPVIGSINSGIADAIKNFETGILVDPKNEEEIAAAVATILKDYSSYSENAKEWARQHDWKIIVKEYVAALEE